MCALLNVGQPIRRAILAPAAVYSRVVSVQIPDLRVGETLFRFTPPLGNRVRLLRVQLWFQHASAYIGPRGEYLFQVYTAKSLPKTDAQVRECDPVLPVFGVHAMGYWVGLQRETEWDWSMDVMYEGAERRFGLYVTQVDDMTLVSFASFTISEG